MLSGCKGELDVASPFDPQVAYDPQGGGPEHLVLLVGERLTRRHDDRIAGMDADRIEILHAAYRDAVVLGVPDHFKFDLFPACDAPIKENLADRAALEAAGGDFHQPLLIIGKSAPAAPMVYAGRMMMG